MKRYAILAGLCAFLGGCAVFGGPAPTLQQISYSEPKATESSELATAALNDVLALQKMSDTALAGYSQTSFPVIDVDTVAAVDIKPLDVPAAPQLALVEEPIPALSDTPVMADAAPVSDPVTEQRVTEAESTIILAEAPKLESVTFEVPDANRVLMPVDSSSMPPSKSLMRVRFEKRSAKVNLRKQERAALVTAAQASSVIEVHGRTDSTGSFEANSRLARERALATKRYLVHLGVPAEKIRVSAMPMGDYVVGNDTAQGRAQNRRVDLVFVAPTQNVKVTVQKPRAPPSTAALHVATLPRCEALPHIATTRYLRRDFFDAAPLSPPALCALKSALMSAAPNFFGARPWSSDFAPA